MDDFEESIAHRLIRQRKGMGWLPDFPDFRDYRPDTDTISVKQKRLGMDEKDSLKSLHLKAGYKGIKSSNTPQLKRSKGILLTGRRPR